MLEQASSHGAVHTGDFLAPAAVLAVERAEGRVQVQPLDEDSGARAWAAMAAPGIERLAPGDQVLAAGRAPQRVYVIGILSCCGAGDGAELKLAGGSRARAVGAERLALFDGDGRLILEYDEASRSARLVAPEGGMTIETGKGDIALKAAGDLRLDACNVHVTGRLGVQAAVMDAQGRAVAGARWSHRGTHLFGPALEALAGTGRLVIGELTYRGRRLEARLARLRCVAEHLDSAAGTVIASARNVYQTVRGLTQLRTGRQRTHVQADARLEAGKVDVHAREDVSIDGERIHLG